MLTLMCCDVQAYNAHHDAGDDGKLFFLSSGDGIRFADVRLAVCRYSKKAHNIYMLHKLHQHPECTHPNTHPCMQLPIHTLSNSVSA